MNMTAAEYLEHINKKPTKTNKFGAKKTETNGVVFDSKKESERYVILKLSENSGLITGLQRQVKFKLVGCNYIADFVYFDYEKKEFVVEDVKSIATKKLSTYRIKKKQMLELYNIKILET